VDLRFDSWIEVPAASATLRHAEIEHLAWGSTTVLDPPSSRQYERVTICIGATIPPTVAPDEWHRRATGAKRRVSAVSVTPVRP
jgi:hypothetical protein